ncbi:MAG: prepilin-type N-terminal cleavage/methylation domain-containing protein, partial [Pseudohongiellaceae bacterium]
MTKTSNHKFGCRGFTLIELMMVTAIIGVLASISMPMLRDYAITARVTEGVTLIDELRRRIEVGYYDNNLVSLPTTIPGAPSPSGQLYGGPYYNYQDMFGVAHEMWDRIELQPKGANRVL